ncbi:MAG: homoserine dehydrogenase [Geminicoccaceae bacterium]|nr:MAG: homoserine dehydrogenase [Geminicoccaceae bacterium]
MNEALRIGVAGLGTVGSGTLAILQGQAELLAARAGRRLEVVAVSARSRTKPRPVPIDAYRWYDDPLQLAADPALDVVLELMGGEDGVALEVTRAALAAGKSVVSANKALLAHRGGELARLAEANGAVLAFEPAVAGGIPIVKALKEGLAGNRVRRVYGILNGTSNYILSTMRATGRDFADVLAEAQALGYAEADPSFDVDGIDAAHKLALLAAIAFGVEPAFDQVHVEGIRQVAATDIAYAEELGYRIKLLGIAEATDHGLAQRLHPCMVPATSPIGQVEGVFNAVVAEGDAVGVATFVGRGAGDAPTGSAVVADLMDLARGHRSHAFGVPSATLATARITPISERRGAYYLRLTVDDRAGVLADVATCLREQNVSVETMIQRHRATDQPVPIVLTTHEADEAAMREALRAIAALRAVREPPRALRIETL